MIEAQAFLERARALGIDFYTGVPCSFLTPLINRVISDTGTTYVGAASEGEALGIAAGAWLAGRQTAVMCQNSGLGNAVNPLTSLNYPFRIPTLLIVTWRAGPGLDDEPQHELMGAITPELLEMMRIPHQPFPSDIDALKRALAEALAYIERQQQPFALILEKGTLADEALQSPDMAVRFPGEWRDRRQHGARPARAAVLGALLQTLPEPAAVIATTGKCGRELFTLSDRAQHLYQVGSMGCASGMGLGVALNTQRPVVVLDGDGAALMKLGTFATIGSSGPPGLVHIVLDNAVHDSTGGQPTVSPNVDFAAIACACGYRRGYACDGLEGFRDALLEALDSPGPHLLHVRITPGSMTNLGRPRVKPPDVARRFKTFLCSFLA